MYRSICPNGLLASSANLAYRPLVDLTHVELASWLALLDPSDSVLFDLSGRLVCSLGLRWPSSRLYDFDAFGYVDAPT